MSKELFFSRVTQLIEHVDNPASTATTLTAAAAKAATSLTVASIAGISNGNTIRVGSGEQCEWNKVSGAPSGSTVTVAFPLGKAHAIGESTIPGISYDFGDPDEGGFKPTIDLGGQDVMLATKRTAYTILRDYASIVGEWALPGFTLPQLASALGIKQAKVTGAGTTASPYQLVVDGTTLGEDINRGVLVTGLLADGSPFFVELHGVDKDYTVFKSTLRQGQLGSIPHKAVACSMLVVGTTLPAYTVNATLKPTKAKVFALPQEFGIYAQAAVPLTTALSVDAAVGATSFTVGDSTNGAVADRVLIETGDNSEILIVNTVPDGTHLTTRNQANYAHLTGATVVEQQQVPFGGVTEEGLDIAIGGTQKEIVLATQRIKGSMPATATLMLGFTLGELRLTNVAYAMATQQADVSGGRLPLSANIGSVDIPNVYFRGLNQGGGTVEVNAFGVTQEIKNALGMLSAKDVAKLPFSFRPCTIQFLQY